MRNLRIHELAKWIDWWPTLVTHEDPFWNGGYFIIEDKPGLGIEINPDVAKAHLARERFGGLANPDGHS